MTTAFDAKSNLVDLLGAQLPGQFPELTGEDTLTVTYGRQQVSPQPRVLVWVGEWNYLDTEPKSIGGGRLQESYDMVVTIEIHRPGDEQPDANTLASTIYDKIQELLRVDRDQPNPLGIDNPVSVVLRPSRFMEGINDDGTSRGAIFISLVRVTARI